MRSFKTAALLLSAFAIFLILTPVACFYHEEYRRATTLSSLQIPAEVLSQIARLEVRQVSEILRPNETNVCTLPAYVPIEAL